MSVELFTSIKEGETDGPVDKIVEQINNLISSGQLKKGEKLPSERVLSEKFDVGRIFVRDAIRKLEFYGIVKTLPRSGTIVAGSNDSAFMGFATNALKLVKPDYQSLMEARFVLEIESAELAADRADAGDIASLEEAVDLLGQKVSDGGAGIEEDLMFHLRVAEASKNEVIKHLVSYLVTHMANFSKEYDICRGSRNMKAYNEHVVILEHIKNGDVSRAGESMRNHLSSLFDFVPPSQNKKI